MLTGVIGLFVIVACAATLHVDGIHIADAGDAAAALEPLAGTAASRLFAAGFLGAALLAIAIVPLSTAYSVAEGRGRPAALDLRFAEERGFYVVFVVLLAAAAIPVVIPVVPLVPILYLSQALNAVSAARDPALHPRARLRRADHGGEPAWPTARFATAATIALVAVSVITLAVLTIA